MIQIGIGIEIASPDEEIDPDPDFDSETTQRQLEDNRSALLVAGLHGSAPIFPRKTRCRFLSRGDHAHHHRVRSCRF